LGVTDPPDSTAYHWNALSFILPGQWRVVLLSDQRMIQTCILYEGASGMTKSWKTWTENVIINFANNINHCLQGMEKYFWGWGMITTVIMVT